MEIDQRLLCNLGGNVSLCLDLLHLLLSSIVGVHICAVVLVVMKLHDLAGDRGLEGAIVICRNNVLLAKIEPFF